MSNNIDYSLVFIPAELIKGVDKLSTNTRLRCDHGVALWQTGKYGRILVSGGLFLSPWVQTRAAASLMAEYLVGLGVPRNCLIIEDESLDTFENIKLSVQALKRAGFGEDPSKWDITVVTQWQHMERFAVSFERMYGITIKRVALNYPMPFFGKLMEYVMIAYHYYDAHGVGVVARSNRDKRRQAALGL